MNKEAFLGNAVKKVSSTLFGSPDKSFGSNALKATGLAALTSSGLKPIPSTSSSLTNTGKGFTMTKTAKLTGLQRLTIPKAPSLNGTAGLKTLPSAGKATGSVVPSSGGTAPKSFLGKTGARKKSRPPKVMRNLKSLGLIAGGAGVIKAVDKTYDAWKKYSDKEEFGGIIDHARKTNPSLKKVPNEKMHEWMHSLYALAPEVARDKGMASSMMNTVHNYGGEIDLATAKIVSEVGHRAKRDGKKVSDLVSPSMSLFLGGD